jgi:hypothetical protein
MNIPKRRHTLLGMQAFQGEQSEAKVEQALRECLAIRYPVTLKKREMIVSGQVVCHVDLHDWLDWHKYTLVSMDGNPDLAMPNERTFLL